MPRMRVTWNGSSHETHWLLGDLVPGQTIDADIEDAALVAAMKADPLFTVSGEESAPGRRRGGVIDG